MKFEGDPKDIYTNRELSWLAFNQRVLDQANNSDNPALERLKFLAITGSNMDEFFMVRVGGLKLLEKADSQTRDITGMTANEQLDAIRNRVRQMMADQYACLGDSLSPELKNHGIELLDPDQLSPTQVNHVRRVFDEEIFSVVSPLALSDTRPFPQMTGAALGLCVRLDSKSIVDASEVDDGNETDKAEVRFAVLPISRALPRILALPSEEGSKFILIEDVLRMFVSRFFPHQKIHECSSFRQTRNADMSIDEEGASDLLAGMQSLIDARKSGDCIRLEVSDQTSPETLAYLQNALCVGDEDTYSASGPIDLAALMPLSSIHGFDELNYKPWPPQPSPDFPPDQNVFDVIAAGDRILFHPFQSFDPVVDFLNTAADDPNVLAIKQTLYRTARNSRIVAALQRAAENGKNVTVILELKARFDEQRNISWAQKLENAGVDVIYGVRGLKTHAKICLVVRREPGGIRRYVHFGTGNYNESTARLYTDISFLTCDPQLGNDAINVFNAITGLSVPQPIHQLAAAPIDLRTRISELIEVETANARRGRPAEITAKLNSLVDADIIDRLYRASQAGVKIRLNVRGLCRLRSGVPGLSDNIEVFSIIDRFLEHARIFHFLHDGDHRVFISSADWMARNLDRRVELMVPVEDAACKKQLLEALSIYAQDNTNNQVLMPDGSYQRVRGDSSEPFRSQHQLYKLACEMHEAQLQNAKTVFQPHRAANESTT